MTSLGIKRTLAAAGAVVLLGGAALGVSYAQTPPARTATPSATAQAGQRGQKFLDALAARLGITTDKLQQAIDGARQDAGLPARGQGGFPGPHGGPGGPHGSFGARGFFAPDVAAKAIGITADQLRQELPGKSLTDVAKAHNADPAKVAAALKDAEHTRIDQAVTNGRLTADQATQAKQRADAAVDQMMTRQFPTGMPRGPRPFTTEPNA